MSVTTVTTESPAAGAVPFAQRRSARRSAMSAFWALTLRDVTVLRKQLWPFLMRTLTQPVLFVFVFAYVFPKIGQGIGGSSPAAQEQFATLLVPGLVAVACIFTGIQAVALPMVQEFGFTREIEDRVMAPLPVALVALQKIVSGAIQSLLAALVVFPIASLISSAKPHYSVTWIELLTILPLATLLGAAFGLTIGTRAEPRQVPLVFGIIVVPMTLLGAAYYQWTALSPIPWLKIVVLVNPLIYMSEGFRAALTTIPHMSLWGVYGGLIGFTLVFGWLGIDGFKRRVLT